MAIRLAKTMLCLSLCLPFLFGCANTSTTTPDVTTQEAVDMELVFTLGEAPEKNNIYVAWIEAPNGSTIQNIRICPRLLPPPEDKDSLTGTALAYWQVNKYPASNPQKDDEGYDAISGATVAKANFTVPFTVPKGFPVQFYLYFETDYSFNKNDWFSEQPSVVYRATIDLDSTANSFTAELIGWAASMDIHSMQSSYIDPMPGHGELETETRYITHTRENDGSFGAVDTSTAIVTKMVGSIVVNRVE